MQAGCRWFSVLSRSATHSMAGGSPFIPKEFARLTGASYLIYGFIVDRADALTLTIELADAETGHIRWVNRYETTTAEGKVVAIIRDGMEYDELTGRLFFRQTHLPEMLRRGRSMLDIQIETVMMIDSLEMTGGDREMVVRACQRCAESRIVITHGTDTMVDTAAALAKAVEGKTVVLTGAMIPYAFGSSDGLFNLGSALSFAQVLVPGVYVAMNGTAFPWNRVKKDRQTGVFVPADG